MIDKLNQGDLEKALQVAEKIKAGRFRDIAFKAIVQIHLQQDEYEGIPELIKEIQDEKAQRSLSQEYSAKLHQFLQEESLKICHSILKEEPSTVTLIQEIEKVRILCRKWLLSLSPHQRKIELLKSQQKRNEFCKRLSALKIDRSKS
ncbi:MAG: hypothetical protein H0X51_09350 [Parachlamydiaceae bacterium]|nr:hypothetical protein [Parachlamydiaceae bacterium]